MSDNPDNTTPPGDGPPPRDPGSGRYVRRHGADDRDGAPGTPDDKRDDEKDGKKRWLLLLLLLLLILALLVCGGIAYNIWWKKKDPDPATTPAATPTVATTASPTAGPTGDPSPNPSANPTGTAAPTSSPGERLINMPNVVGMRAEDAKVILEGAGFTNLRFTTQANPGESLSVLVSYSVSGQSVAAGARVPADAEIVLTCKTSSNGKG